MDTSILNTLAQIAPDLMDEVELARAHLGACRRFGADWTACACGKAAFGRKRSPRGGRSIKRAGCLTQSASGMELTQQGQNLVETARAISGGRRTLSGIELTLSQRLNVERVCVVRGDAGH